MRQPSILTVSFRDIFLHSSTRVILNAVTAGRKISPLREKHEDGKDLRLGLLV